MDVSQVGQVALSLLKSRWGLGLFTALCTGYLTADIANSGVRTWLVVAPGAVQVAPEYGGQLEGETIPGTAARDLNIFSQRNLMGLKREDLTPPDPSEAAADQQKELGDKFSENELRACTLTGSLQATLVASGVPEWSVAIIFDKRESESFAFSINQGNNVIEPDATLITIDSRSIVIRRKDHFERCYGEDEGSTAVPGLPVASAEGGEEGVAPAGGGVTQLSANDYAIDRPELDRVLTNLNEVATQARAVPSFKDGKANGFKMFSIKSGSIYAKIGLKNGDVIQKVNGMELNSPDRALELYQKLKTATSVNMEIQRRGQSRSLNYTIR